MSELNRRDFVRHGALLTLGAALVLPSLGTIQRIETLRGDWFVRPELSHRVTEAEASCGYKFTNAYVGQLLVFPRRVYQTGNPLWRWNGVSWDRYKMRDSTIVHSCIISIGEPDFVPEGWRLPLAAQHLT